jgi:hypothetical protein
MHKLNGVEPFLRIISYETIQEIFRNVRNAKFDSRFHMRQPAVPTVNQMCSAIFSPCRISP